MGLLQKAFDANARIADTLKQKSKSMTFNAVGFSDEKTLGDTFLGPAGGFVVGSLAAAALKAASIPFSTIASVAKHNL